MTTLNSQHWQRDSAEVPVVTPVAPSLDDVAKAVPADVDLIRTRIRARSGFAGIDWNELYRNRDLFRFLVQREIKVRYAQSAIGIGWAILQPLFTMIVFTVIFGRLANVDSDGVPYALFSFIALVPWMYYANAITDGVNNLIVNSPMLSKVYFPRLLMPLASNAARLIDFAVASVVLIGLMSWYGKVPNLGVLLIPWLMIVMVMSAAGTTFWLATFAIQFRDVKHAMGFVVQILMYAAPVVYPASLIPDAYRFWYSINPMVAVVEGMRCGLVGSVGMPWMTIVVGSCSAMLLFFSGMLYFNHKERQFADVA
ncbi:MAG: ABC transporter permease [Planctomycetota bacterium]